MALRFFNSLTLQPEEFAPERDNTVRMYTCGPTVYDYAHIGNFRTFTFYDILRRVLRDRGFQLVHVMNITDVDDKIIRNALANGKSLAEYTAQYTQAFLDDAQALRLERPEHMVRATDHIDEMAAAIRQLADKTYTYESEGSIYYRISKFPEYGKLSHSDFSGIKAGARVDSDAYEKADARDFALWKAPKENEPFWDTGIGPGRPGWHIECSVMAMKYLGETIDIHGGGVDLIFPHHENEIAQSEALTGKTFARFWLHSEFLMVEGQRMGKSLGNFYTLRDLLAQGHRPETIRYLLASVPYRKTLNFTFEGLKSAATAIDRLRNFRLRLQTDALPPGDNTALAERTGKAEAAFVASLEDDLNTAEALAAVFEYIREMNTVMDAGQFPAANAAGALGLLSHFDQVFEVLEPSAAASSISDSEVEAKIAERVQAKKSRDFALADRIRQELLDAGVILEDTREGVRWKRKQ